MSQKHFVQRQHASEIWAGGEAIILIPCVLLRGVQLAYLAMIGKMKHDLIKQRHFWSSPVLFFCDLSFCPQFSMSRNDIDLSFDLSSPRLSERLHCLAQEPMQFAKTYASQTLSHNQFQQVIQLYFSLIPIVTHPKMVPSVVNMT